MSQAEVGVPVPSSLEQQNGLLWLLCSNLVHIEYYIALYAGINLSTIGKQKKQALAGIIVTRFG